jgi:hypothetical protein
MKCGCEDVKRKTSKVFETLEVCKKPNFLLKK